VAVYPGSLVQPGGPALVTISQIDPIGVSFNVPEAQLASLLRGQQAGLGGKAGGARGAGSDTMAGKSAGKASDAAAGKQGNGAAGQGQAEAKAGSRGKAGVPAQAASAGSRVEASNAIAVMLPGDRAGRGAPPPEALQGTISFIDNAVDASTGTIRVKGTLPNAKQQLWPGQYVTVRMTLRVIKDALVVPVAALIQRGAERSVYVVGADGKAEQRVVQQRYVFGDNAVVEGLALGERVVVEGKQNLRSGSLVRESAPEGGRAASGAASSAGARGDASATTGTDAAMASTGAPVSQAGANGTARATSADGVPGNTKAAEARP
jgi:multidrug efflux pump subunit AcrA (membrane-fusion protein)